MLVEEIIMEHKSDTLEISGTNEIEEALRKSEQRFHAFFDHSVMGMAVTSADKKWVEVNDRLSEILGYSRQELIGMTWAEITHPDDLAEQEVKFNRVLNGEADEYEMEKRFIHRDGHLVYTHLASHCIRDDDGSIDYFAAIIEDITERKASEAKMHESESRMRAIIENEPECIKIIDEHGILIEMNPAGLEMIEADSLDQVSGHPVLDVIAPEFRPAYSKLLDKVMAGESVQMEYEVLGLHGGRRSLETHAVPMMDNGKKIHLAITRDISERKKADEKLHLAASVFVHAREAILITSENGTIIDVNNAFSRITGYDREEVLGKNPRILSSRRQGKKFYAEMWRDLIDQGHWYGEIWNRRKNGEIYAEMLTISSILDPQGKIQYYVALFSDITEFKEHERHLERVAHYDALTALPNRTLLADRMKNAIAQAFGDSSHWRLFILTWTGSRM
jgi:PAS domain S-box-containing protein